VYAALETLAAWQLVEPRDGGPWSPEPACSCWPKFGCLDQVRAQVQRHRDERVRYRRALRIVDRHPNTVIGPGEAHLWPPEPPPEVETLLDLLHRDLGAYLVGA